MPPVETDAPAAEMSAKALMARVWAEYLSTQKRRLGVALFCAVVGFATTSFIALWLDPSINLLLHTGVTDNVTKATPAFIKASPLVWIPAVLIAVALIRFIGQRGMTLSLNRIGNSLVGRIQSQLFSRLVHADLGRLQQQHSGQYLSSVLYDADLVREAASTGIVQYVQASLTVVGMLAAMFWVDWSMALIVLAVGPILSFVMDRYLKLTRKAAKGAMAETSSLSTAIMESLDGIKIIKISNQETFEEERVAAVVERRQFHVIKGANARTMAAPATELLTGLLLAGLLAFAGWRALHGSMTAGGLFSFVGSLGIAGQNLRQLSGIQGTFAQGMTAARRLFAALDIKPEIVDAPDAKPLPRDFKALSFDHAGFGYDAAGAVLKDVTFAAKAGQSIALVGPSGSGKSTLLNLIPRFFDLTSGAIRFDNLSHREIGLKSLRSGIALVTQDPFLFDDTIRANIAYGNPDATQAQIEQAAKDAAADEFIAQLPGGYDMRVGEAGTRLSGGQKQRIAIARAFLKNAPLLLLDEATSALDTQSEIKVQQALERLMKGRTTFVVAHRLSTIRHADQILVLDKGEIVERGTHDALIKTNGLYARLAATQFGAPSPVEAESGA
jgi:subfamily B ATP-binding cassette protein MsbA